MFSTTATPIKVVIPGRHARNLLRFCLTGGFLKWKLLHRVFAGHWNRTAHIRRLSAAICIAEKCPISETVFPVRRSRISPAKTDSRSLSRPIEPDCIRILSSSRGGVCPDSALQNQRKGKDNRIGGAWRNSYFDQTLPHMDGDGDPMPFSVWHSALILRYHGSKELSIQSICLQRSSSHETEANHADS